MFKEINGATYEEYCKKRKERVDRFLRRSISKEPGSVPVAREESSDPLRARWVRCEGPSIVPLHLRRVRSEVMVGRAALFRGLEEAVAL